MPQHLSQELKFRIFRLSSSETPLSSKEIYKLLCKEKEQGILTENFTERGIRRHILRSRRRGHFITLKRPRYGPCVSNETLDFVTNLIRSLKGRVSTRYVQEKLADVGTVLCQSSISRVMKHAGFNATNIKYCGMMVWGGISWEGATDIVIIIPKRTKKGQPKTDTVDSKNYCHIIKTALVPFAEKAYPIGDYNLVADSAGCHTSKDTMEFLEGHKIPYRPDFWPPASPDLNPIELIWHEMKNYVTTIWDPKTKGELIDAIRDFWKKRVTVDKCRKYILHCFKMYPEVMENFGRATTK